MSEKYLPESMYNIDSTLIRSRLEEGDIITAKALYFDSKKKNLVVDIGFETAIIPLENITIYPSYYPNTNKLHGSIFSILGKNIRAKVVSLNDTIVLSRKAYMFEALDSLKFSNEFTCCITSFSQLCAFVDVGAGIVGKIMASEFANIHFNDIRDVGLQVGSIINATNLSFNENDLSFYLSRKHFLNKKLPNYSYKEIVEFKVFYPINCDYGFVGLVDGKYRGLLNSNGYPLKYGDEVIASIRSISEKGIKLNFISFKD